MIRSLTLLALLFIVNPLSAEPKAEPNLLDKVNLQTNIFAQFGYYQTDRESAYAIPGVITDNSAFHYEEGLQFMHGELGFLASLDNILATKLIIGSHHGESIELEELWLQPYLHQDWTLRVGRQLSQIGLYNSTHEHDWRFLDTSLTQQAFLGSQYTDDSMQISYAQNSYDLTFWVGRGNNFPAQFDENSASPSAYGLQYQWFQLRNDYQLKIVSSAAYFEATHRSQKDTDGHTHSLQATDALIFDGDTTLVSIGGSLVWSDLNWEFEWMGQSIDSTLMDSQQIKTELDAFQHGITTQLSWQHNNLEIGARYDWLLTDNDVTNTSREFETALNATGHTPQRFSAIANWRFAPYQLLRLQGSYESILQTEKAAFWLVYQGGLTWSTQ
ncbi:hypothetical protein FC650_05365 [Vibrio natriegens]|uniref:hypothetical protein n=1 Tax=Vibrio natriegens TaxID=691 RepID=UPI0015931D42|nr:hypothetical protein [Vibrio natriegens]NVC93084.1 hypothetical protein [Vibrio natriegens]